MIDCCGADKDGDGDGDCDGEIARAKEGFTPSDLDPPVK